ncbi:hypothetical protein [Ichthyenterobacterium magnum]|uniref:Uncharacterized protein n=1 Tax=Ichthyenterobacterium magnum TaxID=1230530 RepID=A0A420DFR0_9FLAO|nr:hypothetical protein [Ichthyenterobacterium magnum]RKE91993.1 hypothetical protein BXY80_2425 [Ichthyenterobacterium magnum]
MLWLIFKAMIKNSHSLLLVVFVFFLSINSISSQTISNCTENYIFKTDVIDIKNSITKDINISWDFSEVSNKNTLSLSIEIQPLNSCWKALEGTNRSKKIIKSIDNFYRSNTGNLNLTYRDLNSKCLKWRAKITDTSSNCTSFTKWQFSSFL